MRDPLRDRGSEPFDPYYIWLGIPPHKQPPNHYCLLGIEPFESSSLVIEHAADQRTAHLRLCQIGPHVARSQELLNEVAAAKICLLRPEKKAAYDAELRRQLQMEAARGHAGPGPAQAVSDPLESLWAVTGASQHRPRRRPARTSLLPYWLGLGAASIAGVFLWQSPALRQAHSGPSPGGQASSPRAVAEQSRRSPGRPAPSPATAGPRPSIARSGKASEEERPLARPHAASAPRPPQGAAPAPATATQDAVAKEAPLDQGGVPSLGAVPELPDAGTGAADEPATPTRAPKSPVRLPVPSPDAQQKAIEQLEETYHTAGVTAPAEKLRLAREFVDLHNQGIGTPAERFALLRRAAELAGEAGNVPRMLGPVDTLAAEFELDALSIKTCLLRRRLDEAVEAAQVPPLVRGAWQVMDQAVAARQYGAALELAELAAAACKRSQCRELRQETQDRLARARLLDEQQREIHQAEETLRSNPQDGQANLLLGRWQCFREDDWAKGLGRLAKGSDRELRLLAERELDSPPTAPEEQLELADAWWRAAQSRSNDEKDPMLLRAGHWYERCGSEWDAGLVRDRIDKRLKEIAHIRRPTDVAPGGPTTPPEGGAAGLWSICPY